jgi:hypothetical protein
MLLNSLFIGNKTEINKIVVYLQVCFLFSVCLSLFLFLVPLWTLLLLRMSLAVIERAQ